MHRASSSSSSSPISQSTHDVFLSFRGKDTRPGFTYNLYNALKREKINAFFDDRELKRGENISASLLRAIEDSKISVVVFSENYASSSWCLDELVKILECQVTKQQIVIPVFYKVNPTDVRRQTGEDTKMEGSSYTSSKFVGLDLRRWYEYDFIEKIVAEIKGLHQKKKNRNGADLYNQAVLAAVQKMSSCTDGHSDRPTNEGGRKLNGAELYNIAILEHQRKS